jgi:hypothetical protein
MTALSSFGNVFLFLAGGILSVIFPVIIIFGKARIKESGLVDGVRKMMAQHPTPGIDDPVRYVKDNIGNAPEFKKVVSENIMLPIVIMALTQTFFAAQNWSLLALGLFIALYLIYELSVVTMEEKYWWKYFYVAVVWALFFVYLVKNIK